MNKGTAAGRGMADVLISWAELFYNQDTKKRVLVAVRDRLDEYIKVIPPSSRGAREAVEDCEGCRFEAAEKCPKECPKIKQEGG